MDEIKIVSSEQAQVASKEAEKTTPKKKVNVDVDAKIISAAYRGFNLCPEGVKSNDLKKAFLLDAAQKLHDEQKFFVRFMAKAEELRKDMADRVSIVEACKNKGIDLLTLATHVVFMGKDAMRRVRRFGIGEKSPINGDLSLVSERFLPDNPQDFVNPYWKPSEHKTEVA